MREREMQDDAVHILLVEDDPDHAELIIRGLRDNLVANRIHHVLDGEAALDYLFRRGEYADAGKSPRPHLMLLDLRLPRVDGLEVLRETRLPRGCGVFRWWSLPLPMRSAISPGPTTATPTATWSNRWSLSNLDS